MADTEENPLLSSTRASDTSPQVQLHPLVLLTVSDYITRHTLRQQSGPVVGAIIGQQNGREITMEVAFEAKLLADDDGEVRIDDAWFGERLEQYKTVFKSPPLDLVGWFTLGAPTGPAPHHLAIHEYIQNVHNESALLLLFHPESVLEGNATGGKLPLTIYESLWEGGVGNDKATSMEIDSGATSQAKQQKFRELTYSVETGEAEMIAVDFVAKGGGNATDVDQTRKGSVAPGNGAGKGKNKGKAKADVESAELDDDDHVPLTAEDEELLASLTAKSNAIKMLGARINLLQAYLSELPPSYLTDAQISQSKNPTERPNHEILRAIQALLSRLPLLAPPDRALLAREAVQQRADVELTNMLASITGSLGAASELGKKFAIIDTARNNRRGTGGIGGPFSMGGRPPFDMDGSGGAGFFDTPIGGGSAAGKRSSRLKCREKASNTKHRLRNAMDKTMTKDSKAEYHDL
ncbi:cop9 signalosome subunit 6 [Diplodia corticola]|uniref:COP9 signalosome complex subunit 6 n=1 Tax=Diplodia corticola TaxID=236234 RepID=A0A1J9S823_9PEZI|nr:cop9 signalosome subunit 6 [Diplodia corticola]OJD36060.1 cop9 signalosome subunit 6 [Diplodia corticola]